MVPKWRQSTRFGGVGLRSGFPSVVLRASRLQGGFPPVVGWQPPRGMWFVAAKGQRWDGQPTQGVGNHTRIGLKAGPFEKKKEKY